MTCVYGCDNKLQVSFHFVYVHVPCCFLLVFTLFQEEQCRQAKIDWRSYAMLSYIFKTGRGAVVDPSTCKCYFPHIVSKNTVFPRIHVHVDVDTPFV